MSDVLERLLRYVVVGSQSDPSNAKHTPSTDAQHAMARLLERELEDLGLKDVTRDKHAYVTASLPASPDACGLPALGLIAHIDTSSAVPGMEVKPRVIIYEGGDLYLGGTQEHPVAITLKDCPDLAQFEGQEILCSDGSTLLGVDDKAGVAEICALLARLVADKTLPHPRIKVAFVPDEEIGHGARLLELHDFGATWAYTVDGGELGEISYETFNAYEARVTINGIMAHPGYAKDVMINAISVFREFDAALPERERPETTDGYEGYFYCNSVEGDTSKVVAAYILRDFEDEGIARRCEQMNEIAERINRRLNRRCVSVEYNEQYRNMADALKDCMFLVDHAVEANRDAGVTPLVRPVRGGTDGSQLSLRGLPCPNLANGGYNFHSVREFVPVASLETQVEVLLKLVEKFAVPQNGAAS